MRIFLSASQDATIYERYPTYNTGLDEILEIGKVIKPLDTTSMYASGSARALIQFDLTKLSSYPTNSVYFLNFYIANAQDVHRYQNIEVYPISQSWNEGSGYFYQNVKNVQDGVTWENRDEDIRWIVSGSDYIASPSASYTFELYPLNDISIDVTDIIKSFATNSNYGMVIKFPDADEIDSLNRGNIKLFSSNTHTVFFPKLEVLWNDQTFTTGSLKPIPNSTLSIIPRNLKETYTQGEVDKIQLIVRDKYPDRRFDEVQRYRNTYYLPTSSYYRIVDEASGVVLYDYDEYSSISCDASGSFFVLDTNAFNSKRYYRIELKVVSDTLVFYPDFSYSFKVDTNG